MRSKYSWCIDACHDRGSTYWQTHTFDFGAPQRENCIPFVLHNVVRLDPDHGVVHRDKLHTIFNVSILGEVKCQK